MPGSGDRASCDVVSPCLQRLEGGQDEEGTAAWLSPSPRCLDTWEGFRDRLTQFQSPPSLFLRAQALLSRQATMEGCRIFFLGEPSLDVKKQQISFSLEELDGSVGSKRLDVRQLPFSPKLPYRDEEGRAAPTKQGARTVWWAWSGQHSGAQGTRQAASPTFQPTVRP